MDCIFCKIAGKKASAEILYEDDIIMSFLDIRPVNFGHALVIPRDHYENFISVPADKLKQLITVTQKVAASVNNSLEPDGYNIVANNGIAAGQSVFHFHFHIIPRFVDDDFKFKLNLKSYPYGIMGEFAEKIKAELNK